MKPLGNKVVVKPEEEAQKTASGIVLPSTHKGDMGQGVVTAVGAGARTMSGDLIPMEVAEGDQVLFPRKQGVEVKVGGEDFLIFYETDILCVL